MDSYMYLRHEIHNIREDEKILRDAGYDLSGLKYLNQVKRSVRQRLSAPRDRFEKSMIDCEDWRSFSSDETGASWCEYAIFKDDGSTDEEINEMIDNIRREIRSPYDCTGRPFTTHIHWSRQPIGIVVVHHLALDI